MTNTRLSPVGIVLFTAFLWLLLVRQAVADQQPQGQGDVAHFNGTVLATLPAERRNFTQGLYIHGDELYVSSGLYGQSAVRVYSWPGLMLLREAALPSRFFAEGLTVIKDRIYLLTWRARQLLILDSESLATVGTASIGSEGWGITHHESSLWLSDGTDRIYHIDLANGGKVRPINVTLDGRPVKWLNELEYIRGRIWANVWQSENIVIINPESGAVEGVVHLDGLLTSEERYADTDVLNGIAHDPEQDAVWVTGKRWPTLFRIGLQSQPDR